MVSPSQQQMTPAMVIIAILAALGLVGVVGVTIFTIQEAEAGCRFLSTGFANSGGKCFKGF